MFYYCSVCWKPVYSQNEDLSYHAAHSSCSKIGEVVFLRQPPNKWFNSKIETVWFAPDSLQLVQTRFGNPLLGEEAKIVDSRMRRLAANILNEDVVKSLHGILAKREKDLSTDGKNHCDQTNNKKIISQINRAITLGKQLQEAINLGEITCIGCLDTIEGEFHLFLSNQYVACKRFHGFCCECWDKLVNYPVDPRKSDYRSNFNSAECTMCFNTDGFYQRVGSGDGN